MFTRIALIAALLATPAAAHATILKWSKNPAGGFDIILAPLKPAPASLQCMEFWHGNAELPLGAGGAFRRDRCS